MAADPKDRVEWVIVGNKGDAYEIMRKEPGRPDIMYTGYYRDKEGVFLCYRTRGYWRFYPGFNPPEKVRVPVYSVRRA